MKDINIHEWQRKYLKENTTLNFEEDIHIDWNELGDVLEITQKTIYGDQTIMLEPNEIEGFAQAVLKYKK
jgi:hypothetical protein